MNRNDKTAIKELLSILNTETPEQQKKTIQQLKQIINKYEQVLTIPATTYNTKLTQLETTSTYLQTHHKQNTKQIAEQLQRPITTITNAINNANKKKINPKKDEHTPYRIPTTAFNKTLSPAETITHYLYTTYNLPNKTISELLGRDQRATHKTLQRAKKKILGGEKQ